MYRECLQKIIGFDKWHLNSLDKRSYARLVIGRINDLIQDGKISHGMIVEVGCGLGDIISSVNWRNKQGYDIDKKVIWGARMIHPLTSFRVGTFDAIRGKKISVLMALNFLHQINDENCYRYFKELTSRNEVEVIVVDDLQSPPYRYAHDYEKLFWKVGYALEYKSRGYVAWKHSRGRILYFRKNTESGARGCLAEEKQEGGK